MTHDPLATPTFLQRGHPDHDKAVAEGQRILSNRPAPAKPPLAPPTTRGKRKRRSSAEIATLRALGFDAEEIRSLSVKETERICGRGEPAGTWRTNRAMRELGTIGK